MDKVRILDRMPIIITKDANWINTYVKNTKAEEGAIWLLPQDAILLLPPEKENNDESI